MLAGVRPNTQYVRISLNLPIPALVRDRRYSLAVFCWAAASGRAMTRATQRRDASLVWPVSYLANCERPTFVEVIPQFS